MSSTETPTTPLREAFDQMMEAVARQPGATAQLWETLEKLEEQVYPEHFVEDDDQYDGPMMCECEIDWHCGCGNHPLVRDEARIQAEIEYRISLEAEGAEPF